MDDKPVIIIDGRYKVYNNLEAPFSIKRKDIRPYSYVDESDDGQSYNKTIMIMNDKASIDPKLLQLCIERNKYVSKVVHYIIVNLPYGTNVLRLPGSDIAEQEHIHTSDVSKAIKELIEENIILRVRDIPIYKDNTEFPKNTFVVNHNFIFKGNPKTLYTDFVKQQESRKENKTIKYIYV